MLSDFENNMQISIHAPREGGDFKTLMNMRPFLISIHAPREGGDTPCFPTLKTICKFQSTPPARGATSECTDLLPDGRISIHAPREGGDPAFSFD